MHNKTDLRKAVRAAFPDETQRQEESQRICTHLLVSPLLQSAKTICLYVPLKKEADILPLVQALLGKKTVVLPRVEAENHLTLRRIHTIEDLAPGAYGIPEPSIHAEIIQPETIDLLVVPLEAIDPHGMRLGKGGGYYDRLLPKVHCPTIGAVLSHQWVHEVPADPWDIPLSAAVDANGIRWFSSDIPR